MVLSYNEPAGTCLSRLRLPQQNTTLGGLNDTNLFPLSYEGRKVHNQGGEIFGSWQGLPS